MDYICFSVLIYINILLFFLHFNFLQLNLKKGELLIRIYFNHQAVNVYNLEHISVALQVASQVQ